MADELERLRNENARLTAELEASVELLTFSAVEGGGDGGGGGAGGGVDESLEAERAAFVAEREAWERIREEEDDERLGEIAELRAANEMLHGRVEALDEAHLAEIATVTQLRHELAQARQASTAIVDRRRMDGGASPAQVSAASRTSAGVQTDVAGLDAVVVPPSASTEASADRSRYAVREAQMVEKATEDSRLLRLSEKRVRELEAQLDAERSKLREANVASKEREETHGSRMRSLEYRLRAASDERASDAERIAQLEAQVAELSREGKRAGAEAIDAAAATRMLDGFEDDVARALDGHQVVSLEMSGASDGGDGGESLADVASAVETQAGNVALVGRAMNTVLEMIRDRVSAWDSDQVDQQRAVDEAHAERAVLCDKVESLQIERQEMAQKLHHELMRVTSIVARLHETEYELEAKLEASRDEEAYQTGRARYLESEVGALRKKHGESSQRLVAQVQAAIRVSSQLQSLLTRRDVDIAILSSQLERTEARASDAMHALQRDLAGKMHAQVEALTAVGLEFNRVVGSLHRRLGNVQRSKQTLATQLIETIVARTRKHPVVHSPTVTVGIRSPLAAVHASVPLAQ